MFIIIINNNYNNCNNDYYNDEIHMIMIMHMIMLILIIIATIITITIIPMMVLSIVNSGTIRKGTNGVSTNGVMPISCFYRGTLWVPICQNLTILSTFFSNMSKLINSCSGPIRADPICPQPNETANITVEGQLSEYSITIFVK